MADNPQPKSTVKIEKTITNAPITDEDLDTISDQQPRRQQVRPRKEEPEADGDEFHQLLQDHTVRIHVDRVSPREWKGKQISGMIEEYVPPSTQEEIETDIRNRFGGGRYRIRILKNGRFLGARGVSIYGDPKLPPSESTEEDEEEFPFLEGRPGPMGMQVPGGPPIQDDELTELRKQIEKERLKKVLDEVKGGNPNAAGNFASNPDVIRRESEERVRREMRFENDINSLKGETDRKLDNFMSSIKEILRSQKETDPGRSSDIVSLDNKVERIKTEIMGEMKSVFSDIKAQFAPLHAQPKQDTTPQLFQAIIEGFSKISNSSDDKLRTWAEAERSKMDMMLSSFREISSAQMKVSEAQSDKMLHVLSHNKDGGLDGVAKTVSAVREMAEAMGFQPAGGGGEEAESGEQPDMMSRIMGLVEKALPTLLAAQRQKASQTGNQQQLNQQEIQQIVAMQARAEAQRIAPALAQQIAAQRIGIPHQPQQQQQQPPPVPQQQQVQRQQFQQNPSLNPSSPPGVPQGVVRPPMAAPPQVQAQPQAQTPLPVQPPIQPPVPQEQIQQEEVPLEVVETVPEGNGQNPMEAVVIAFPEQPRNRMTDVDRAKSEIVNKALSVIVKEVQIRPRASEWNEYAFDTLPEDILDRVVMVTDAEGLLSAVEPWADAHLIELFKEAFRDNQRAVDWFVKGLNEMKTWYAEDGVEVEEEQVEKT
jgi:hypothetical protein